jgi:hypothetical protein
MAHNEVENRPVVEPVVVDPTPKGGIRQLREVAKGEIAPKVKAPAPHFLVDRRGRLRADRWVEADEHLPAVAFGQSRLKRVAEKVKFHIRIGAAPTVILAVGDLRLLRMQRQETSGETLLDRILEVRCLRFRTTVANHVVRVTLERDVREFPAHPEIERIVEIEICQNRTSDALNAKGNFCFDRVIRGWRGLAMVDLRRKT